MSRNKQGWLGMIVALAFGSAGCSLGLFQDPPNEDVGETADDAGDVEVAADGDADGDDGADGDADADVPPGCGNGVEDDGEECDDGNDVEGDGCDNDCTWSCTLDVHCRDTETCNGAETCDTASHTCAEGTSLDDGTPCSLPDGGGGECRRGVCRSLTCGDEIIDDGEECDDGNDNENDRCPSTCFDAICGDEFVWDEEGGVEECDDGNGVEGDGCDGDCTWSCDVREDCDDEEPCNGVETCTDHVCELLSPPLEEGAPCTTSSGASGNCSAAMCMPSTCGNGTIEAGEECDDGGHVAGDGCEPNCLQSCHDDAECHEAPDNPCSDDSCSGADAFGGRVCNSSPNSNPCDDGLACTGSDRCAAGACAGTPIDGDGDTYPMAPCGSDCDDTKTGVHPGVTDICNGQDDDCDGATDEGFVTGVPCDGSDDDLCADGVLACAGASGEYCTDDAASIFDLCDGIDNDCDGATDEGFPSVGTACYTGDAATRGVGACRDGTTVCDASTGGTSVRCDGEVLPRAEICNDYDDDCDNDKDEELWCPWGNVGNVFLNDVWIDDDHDIGFAVGYHNVTNQPVIARWYPGSTVAWDTEVTVPVTSRALHGVWGFDTADAWAAGTDALLYRFDGTGWVPVPSAGIPWLASSTTMYGMWGAPSGASGIVWVVGSGGAAYLWNSGIWSSYPAATTSLNGVCGAGPGAVWAVGVGGRIARWSGSVWSNESIGGFSGELNECWALAADNVWAVGGNGTILKRSSSSWTEVLPRPTIHTLNGVWGSPDTATFAVGDGGTILRNTVGGWVPELSPTAIELTAIHGRGGSAPLAVAVDRLGDVWRWHPQR